MVGFRKLLKVDPSPIKNAFSISVIVQALGTYMIIIGVRGSGI